MGEQMSKSLWLLSTALVTLAHPAQAQVTPAPAAGPSATDVAGAEAPQDAPEAGDIVVTATRRSALLSDVPLAISAVTAETLARSGGTDIRGLNQISPSLLVSSSSTEAQGGGARIRGIGTVGDNPGLESSVATFIDGVYRNRSGVGLTELGAIDRIEVLRGPQGTLFGRNASAGLISVITAKPSFEEQGTAELSYGNYDYWRGLLGLTGPIGETLAYRLDGVYTKRDGFIDVTAGTDRRKVNDRNRWLVRGQLLFEPNEALSVRLIADYAKRNEECCVGVYVPTRNVSRAADGSLVFGPSTVAPLLRALGAQIDEDTYARRASIPQGRSFRSDVRDGGVSAEINYDTGFGALTSITAYRDWKYVRGQAANFNNLDLLFRDDDGSANQRFKTFTQELRLQGKAFGDRLDWLVGGYFANEKLILNDNLSYGRDFERYANCLLLSSVLPTALAPTPTGSCVNVAVVQATLAGLNQLPATDPRRQNIPLFSALLANPARPGFGSIGAALGLPAFSLTSARQQDHFEQTSRNFAIFTHNVFDLTDRLSLTLGARYTNERKMLDAVLTDNNLLCAAVSASPLAALQGIPCINPSVPGGRFVQNDARKSERRFTGTAVLSYKPIDDLLTYASYSRGYKAGGFNLDRNSLNRVIVGSSAGPVASTANLQQLTFAPEGVDALEIGAKYNGRGFDLNLSAFYQIFDNFQLNTFNGINFVVENINGCSTDLGTAPIDAISGNGACTGKVKGGVKSKGVEAEAFMRLSRTFQVTQGFTLADTRYRRNLVGTAGRPLSAPLFQLPGSRLSNSALYTVTGSVSWTPPLGGSGLGGLVYVDYRYQSGINTGSDLDIEKENNGVFTVNARVGITGADRLWSVELWGQNITKVNYRQVGFDMPLQGSGTTRQVASALFPATTTSTQLYGAFLAEPRTYGLTVRTVF
jgi:iron complex outermembrane receptor protein